MGEPVAVAAVAAVARLSPAAAAVSPAAPRPSAPPTARLVGVPSNRRAALANRLRVSLRDSQFNQWKWKGGYVYDWRLELSNENWGRGWAEPEVEPAERPLFGWGGGKGEGTRGGGG